MASDIRKLQNNLNDAKPYEDNEHRPDEIKTMEEFERALATLKKHIDEGVFSNK